MSTLKIYMDVNYPLGLYNALEQIHGLQKEKHFELIRWKDETPPVSELRSSIFLLVDHKKRGLEIPTVKHFEAGYRVIVCKAAEKRIDQFEFAMTVLRVWPFMLERAKSSREAFLYTFRYGGRRLVKHSSVSR